MNLNIKKKIWNIICRPVYQTRLWQEEIKKNPIIRTLCDDLILRVIITVLSLIISLVIISLTITNIDNNCSAPANGKCAFKGNRVCQPMRRQDAVSQLAVANEKRAFCSIDQFSTIEESLRKTWDLLTSFNMKITKAIYSKSLRIIV